jgi:hypothetical protein
MHTSERITSTIQYVIDGVIREPKTWILLSIFGIGNFLIDLGQNSLIYKYFHELEWGNPVSLPQPFHQYAMYVVLFLIFVGILLMIIQTGYVARIYRSITPAPPVSDMKTLFWDGFILSIIGLVYRIIPVMIGIWIVVLPLTQIINDFRLNSSTLQSLELSPELIQTIGIVIGGLLLSGTLYIIVTIFSIIGFIRFSRTGRIRSAFEINAILTKIGEIGWIRYLLSLLFLFILAILFSCVIYLITGIFIFF